MRDFLAACIITPLILFAFLSAVYPFIPGARAELEQIKKERQIESNRLIDAEVSTCIETQAPWDCFEHLRELDIIQRLKNAPSRTERFAARVQAERVFLFCGYERKAQCANTMVRYGYALADVEPLLKRYYDRDPEEVTER